jgi:hypothetical protein
MANPQMVILEGDGSFEIEVVGESRYHANLASIAGRGHEDGVDVMKTAYLVPEPKNPNDSNAVRVDIDEKKVGYLRRELAAVVSPALRRAKVVGIQAQARITAGFDGGSYSVWIDGDIDELLAFLSKAKPGWRFW